MSDTKLAAGTQFSAHPVMFKARPFSFLLSVLLIPVGVGILILMVWYLKCKSSKLEIIDNEVVYEKGLLSKEKTELNLASIRSVRVYQSFMNRIFGVGKITVYTAGDSPEFEIEGIPDPQRFRELT